MVEIGEYIKNCFSKGFTKEQIKDQLVKYGWKETDVNKAFYSLELEEINNKLSQIPKPDLVPMGKTEQTAEELFNNFEQPQEKKSILPKFKFHFTPDKNTNVQVCPKCKTVMISKDVEEFLKQEMSILRSKQEQEGL